LSFHSSSSHSDDNLSDGLNPKISLFSFLLVNSFKLKILSHSGPFNQTLSKFALIFGAKSIFRIAQIPGILYNISNIETKESLNQNFSAIHKILSQIFLNFQRVFHLLFVSFIVSFI